MSTQVETTETVPAVGETVAITTSAIGIPGRYLVSAGRNHFISDARASAGGPGEAVTAGELLLASLGSCSLALIHKAAGERGDALTSASVDVAFRRDVTDSTRYEWIRIVAKLGGVDEAAAAALIGAFTEACPIYNTLKRGGPVEISWAVF